MNPPPTSSSAVRARRLVAVGTVFALFLCVAWWLKQQGHLLGGLLALAAGGWAARTLWTKLTPPPAPDEPMVSLVLLLKQPRYLEAKVLAEILRSAWGLTFSTSDGDPKTPDLQGGPPWILGRSPIFMVNTGDAMFVVHNHDRLYFGEIDDLDTRVPELRLRTIIREHQAWISVDAMGVADGPETAAAYAKISRALAELADETVLGLFQPAANRLTAWDSSLETRLRQGENLNELFALNQAPVVQVSPDDPRMQAAVAEARRRWPEFKAAFAERRPAGNYAVKAPVTREGNTEFIWLEVVGLEPDYVHGKLANDPVNLGALKIGDQVEVPAADLNDWTYRHSDDAETVGLFTVKVLTDAYQQQIAEAKKTS